jgi:penicillin amidase
MKKISFNFLYPLLALLLLVTALNRKFFMVPPLGSFLNPFRGVVQNANKSTTNLELNYARNGSIEILFDERSIPHIFSDNQKDLFFAQGYVCASDRLWQMDFLSYVSAGRLSEILGEDFLENDRHQRRSGITTSAIATLKLMESQQETKEALDNYTEGVNAFINHLSDSNLPLEYKLLDYHPEPWTNLKSVLILKYMASLLSGYEEDVPSSYLLAILGKKEYDKLFSRFLIDETKDRFALKLMTDTSSTNAYINLAFLESSSQISKSPFNPRLGSNNWAISPKKSASGSAILCNDPHLPLSFPAIWYELQLNAKDMNVYGYSIPGTPGVVIGYNQHISWGVTNGAVDVSDLFKLELKPDYSQYKFDGHWKNTIQTIEEIKIKNSKPFYDTVFYTVHGPISSDLRFGRKEKAGYASNWTSENPSNEFLAFLRLNKATNYEEFKEAISHFSCPVQNFAYADVQGNIAMHLQGEILESHLKSKGKFIMDGTKSSCLSTERLTYELPFLYNPSQEFVYSANNNPFYKNDSFFCEGYYSELRSGKIKTILSKYKKFTIEDMKSMQLDNTNRLAELALPLLIHFISQDTSKYAKQFRVWDSRYTKESEQALLFEQWWNQIRLNTWDELRRFKRVDKFPDDLILLDLISNEPNNKYFDILSTDKIENAGDVIRLSFKEITEHLPPHLLQWGNYNKLNIMHLLNIPAFSKLEMTSPSSPNAINALNGNWAPSLRLIVEMGKRPQGYGIYVGGQSGNPASEKYDQFVDDWRNGTYYKQNFFFSKEEAKDKTKYKWIINK